MVFEILLPLMVIEPDDDDTEYPDTLLVVYEYVPLASEKEYDVPVIAPESIPLLRLTYHVVPEDNPDSVNITVYLTSENETDLETEPPFTVKEPEDGDDS